MHAEKARSVCELKNYSSLLVRASSSEAATALMHRIASDKAQPLRAETEFHYYEQQTRAAVPIKMLGEFLAAAMSVGALFAAMNTMYARIGSRTREIGTLRVLGYRRRTILGNLLVEGAMLAALGSALSCVGGLLLPAWRLARGTSLCTMRFS